MAIQPNSRLLHYLPAIFQTKPDADREPFLGQYLLPFEHVYDDYDALLASLDRYFAADLAPAQDFLPWLATWVALLLDTDWDEDRQRRLLGEAVELYRWRGTVYGLKRYLHLYTDLAESAIQIEEGRRPGGMQMDFAARIGGVEPVSGPADAGDPEAITHDYYVVDTVAPAMLPLAVALPNPPKPVAAIRLYYRADWVERVQIEDDGVAVRYRPGGDGPVVTCFHPRPQGADPACPNIRRLNEMTDYYYHRAPASGSDSGAYRKYQGGSFLIRRVPAPYHFVLDIQTPTEEKDLPEKKPFLDKVRAIVDLEKPAHTAYFLTTSPATPRIAQRPMQIEVRSSIGLDTAVG